MKSSELYNIAKQVIPGGVSSPVRAIQPYPFYITSGHGPRLTTADGANLIDCCCAYGPLILGHAHPAIKEAIIGQLSDGWLYGTPAPAEITLAEQVIRDHPSIEMVRFVSSGSEATMAALRLARGFTGRTDIIKIEGGFHGAHDAVLVQAGSGCTTLGQPDSAGVPADLVKHTRQIPYNDIESLSSLLEKDASSIAALILEPVLGNIGPILPEKGYLEDVRAVTAEHDVLLIFDEVITGYRLGIGGAQRFFGIKPDLTTLGKILGGGLPIGAFGGRKDIMSMVAPAGPVYQAGTFSGNPLSLTAGIATLNWIHEHPGMYTELESKTSIIEEACTGKGGSFVRMGSMFKYYFRNQPPRNYREAKEADTTAFRSFWEKMLKTGIFLPPSQFETNFISVTHSEHEIEAISQAYKACI
ncbi:MAG TPA: glutamate-1-semialdehyde 2,1-aminomutase [Methanospirillum sp.]|uniref:glutamate-1-semialdehyde 2,1-aminomutase n=1 Tax=Methanospirillum sp. TaxID=45200 RepID=UPI002C70292F|nr:glutamate-1-semialdehyde 2,1-aminomutase [Methanospirillum sp.]HWQ64373.1 glutamate-1-semialdehyde 2,1-aminomutase [Methanospirillum sp.]